MIPVHVHSLGFDEANDQRVLILQEDSGHRVVPIVIGTTEAMAIMFAAQGVEPPRPLTHNLLMSVIEAAGLRVDRVEITRVQDGTFFASLILRGEHGAVSLDARPSDSLALAVRAECPVFVHEEVMAASGIVPEDEAEEEVAAFRDFLDNVEPEDFETS